MRRLVRSSQGFSIIQVVIASVLAIGVGYFLVTLLSSANRSQQFIVGRSALDNVMKEASQYFKSSALCQGYFQDKTFDSTAANLVSQVIEPIVINHPNNSSKVVLGAGAKLDGGVVIQSVSLVDFVSLSVDEYSAKLRVTASLGSGPHVLRSLPLVFNTAVVTSPTRKIVNCVIDAGTTSTGAPSGTFYQAYNGPPMNGVFTIPAGKVFEVRAASMNPSAPLEICRLTKVPTTMHFPITAVSKELESPLFLDAGNYELSGTGSAGCGLTGIMHNQADLPEPIVLFVVYEGFTIPAGKAVILRHIATEPFSTCYLQPSGGSFNIPINNVISPIKLPAGSYDAGTSNHPKTCGFWGNLVDD